MKGAGIAFLLFSIAACGEPAAPSPPPPPPPAKTPQPQAAPADEPKDLHDRSKNPEVFRKFVAFMKDNQKQNKAIKHDIEKKAPTAEIKAKLEQIRKNAAGARALHYRKPEEDDAKIDTDFELFDLKILQLIEEDWPEEKREDQYERLQSRCNTCHETYRD